MLYVQLQSVNLFLYIYEWTNHLHFDRHLPCAPGFTGSPHVSSSICSRKNFRNKWNRSFSGWMQSAEKQLLKWNNHHNHSTALFPGPPGWASARRQLLDFMVQGKINRGRHTDQLAGRHSIRTNQCPPPLSPHFLQAGCPSCRPTNSVKTLKDWHQYLIENIKFLGIQQQPGI